VIPACEAYRGTNYFDPFQLKDRYSPNSPISDWRIGTVTDWQSHIRDPTVGNRTRLWHLDGRSYLAFIVFTRIFEAPLYLLCHLVTLSLLASDLSLPAAGTSPACSIDSSGLSATNRVCRVSRTRRGTAALAVRPFCLSLCVLH
jgi:hypothetical protein